MFPKTEYSSIFLICCMLALAIIICACLVRAVMGPRYTDRIVAANMIGTKTNVFVCLLAVFLGEEFLVDVGLIYSMLSFLAVAVLSKIIITRHRIDHKSRLDREGAVLRENRSHEEEASKE